MRSLLLLLAVASTCCAAAPPAPWKLTAEDRKFLDGLFAFLVNPTGAERVSVPAVSRYSRFAFASLVEEREAWRFPADAGKRARIVGADGDPILPRGGVKRTDFLAECRKRLLEEPIEKLFVGGKIAIDLYRPGKEPDLALAAWIHRLGQEGLAAHLLHRLEDRKEAAEQLRETLSWAAFSSMVNAFKWRDDGEALASGEHFLRVYPGTWRIEQAAPVIADLRRRKKEGLLGVRKPFPPKGFATWTTKRRIAYLIDALDDVEAYAGAEGYHVEFLEAPSVAALVEIGDAAVPALLDAAEKDNRLTRTILRYWLAPRDGRTVPVKEAASQALRRILRADFFGVKEDGLRAYWKAHGHIPLPRRLMTLLTDKKATPGTRSSAAVELSRLGSVRDPDPFNEWMDRWKRVRPNPALALDRPTVAEAMLAAITDDTRTDFLDALAQLGDRRALPALHRMLKTTDEKIRREVALACRRLGSSRPLDDYADDFATGRLKKTDKGETVSAVLEARPAARGRALAALVRPGHWAHAWVRESLLVSGELGSSPWYAHPFWVAILEQELGNEALTGIEVTYRSDRVFPSVEWYGNSTVNIEDAEGPLLDPARRLEKAKERIKDKAARKLSRLIAGAPWQHPLAKDREERLKELKSFLAKHGKRFRAATYPEAEALTPVLESPEARLIPGIRPLGRAATADDVGAGQAVFHLGGKGKPVEMELPAIAAMKDEAGVIVQAEADEGGTVTYGVILRHAIRRVEAKEVLRIRPLPK